MTDVLVFIFDAIGSAMTLYGVAYVLAFSRPLIFYENFASRAVPTSKLGAGVVYSLLILKVIAIGMFLYHAGSGVFDIVPADWIHEDEDGEPLGSTRGYLQVMLSVIGTAYALDGEGKVSAEGKRLQQERREKWGY